VQLKHDDKETSWEAHGYVNIYNAKGELIAECADLQHNRKYGEREGRAKALAEEVVAALGKGDEGKVAASA